MKRPGRWLAFAVLGACSPREPAPVVPARAAPPAEAAAPADAAGCLTLAPGDPIDLNGDGLPDVAVREDSCGLRCDYKLYTRSADGCATLVGEIHDLMSEPYCKVVPHGWCTLSGMRLMIHGDAQEYLFIRDGDGYRETHGTHYVPPEGEQR